MKEYQFYTSDNQGTLLHAGVHKLGNFSHKTIKKHERKWLIWRYNYVKNHPGNYPTAQDFIMHREPKYITVFPINEPKNQRTFTL